MSSKNEKLLVRWLPRVLVVGGMLVGLIAVHKGAVGFDLAPDAGDVFFAKLPVLFLVALLIERTVEIFLTIWRSGESLRLERELVRVQAGRGTHSAKDASTKSPEELAEELAEKLQEYKNGTRRLAMALSFLLALLISTCGFRAVEGLVVLRPVSAEDRTGVSAADVARATERLASRIRSDRESLERVTDVGDREILKRQQDDAWTGWLEKELKAKTPADRPGEGASGEAASIGPNAFRREILFFRFFDILLTAGLLAGGADPISRIMKLVRDFLDESNKWMKNRNKNEEDGGEQGKAK